MILFLLLGLSLIGFMVIVYFQIEIVYRWNKKRKKVSGASK